MYPPCINNNIPALRIFGVNKCLQHKQARKNAPPDSTTTSKPALVSSPTASGLRLTRFSPLYVSLMTPTVSSPYGMGWPRILDS